MFNCILMVLVFIRWFFILFFEGFNYVYMDMIRFFNEVMFFFYVGKCLFECFLIYWLFENVVNDVFFIDSDVSLVGKFFGSDVWV